MAIYWRPELTTISVFIGTIVLVTFFIQGFTWSIYILAALVVALAQWGEEKLSNAPSKNTTKKGITN